VCATICNLQNLQIQKPKYLQNLQFQIAQNLQNPQFRWSLGTRGGEESGRLLTQIYVAGIDFGKQPPVIMAWQVWFLGKT